MSSARTFASLGIVLVVILAGAVATAWLLRPAGPPLAQQSVQARIDRTMYRLVELKDRSLAELENHDFRTAEPSLIELATVGIGEPIGSRNWLINRISIVGTMDEAKDAKAYADALDRCRTAINLEWNLEREGAVRYYLAAKVEFLSHNIPKQLEDLHNGAGRAQDDPLIWYALYAAERDIRDESVRADGESALKSLFDFVPNNLHVLLEWMGVQARRKDPAIVSTLERAREHLLPFLADIPVESPIPPARAISDASAAAQKGDWSAVLRNVTALEHVAAHQPAVRNDRLRVDRSLAWSIKTDFSDKFYREHPFDRVLPKNSGPVQFRDVRLAAPLGDLTDVRDARFVDFNSDGHRAIAVLRKSALEIYGQGDSAEKWKKIAEASLPSDGFNHLLPADLFRSARVPGIGFVVFGPAGALVVENQLKFGANVRSLAPIASAAMAERTKDAQSVVAVDLDHDGALDLVVVRKGAARSGEGSSGPNSGAVSIWRNQYLMGFADVTPRSGLVPPPMTGRSLVAVDWNHDFDMDVLLAGGEGSTGGVAFLQGAGEGRFRLEPLAPDNSVFQTATVLALLDADANGSSDVLAVGPAGMAILETSSSQPGEVHTLRTETVSDFPAEGLFLIDYDNDGCQDIVAWNHETLRCFHGVGNGRFETAGNVLPANLATIVTADSADIDSDGDLDLLVVSPEAGGGRLHLLKNDGGNANNWIDVHLSAGPLASEMGTTLVLKTGVVCQARVASGPITHFGIGNRDSADILRIVWPTVRPQDIMAPAKNTVVRAGPAPVGWR